MGWWAFAGVAALLAVTYVWFLGFWIRRYSTPRRRRGEQGPPAAWWHVPKSALATALLFALVFQGSALGLAWTARRQLPSVAAAPFLAGPIALVLGALLLRCRVRTPRGQLIGFKEGLFLSFVLSLVSALVERIVITAYAVSL